MENCHIKNLKKELWKNIEDKQSYIHLKSEKQLKKCDRQIFSAFMHGFELPTLGAIDFKFSGGILYTMVF